MAETSFVPEKPTPITTYVNNDIGKKIPLTGEKAPEGPYNDFRFGFKKPLLSLGEGLGGLAFDMGTWLHSPLNGITATKIRWWSGLTYGNRDWLGAFATARIYAGCVPEGQGDPSMIAIAGALGIKPQVYGPLRLEISGFGVFDEKYYNALFNNAQFYIGTIALALDFDNVELKATAQVWYVDTNKTDPTTHIQIGGGATVSF